MKLDLKKSLIVLLLILMLGGFLRVYKLGQQSFIADEYLGINASYGYFKTGEWKFWDFNNEKLTDREYTRGSIYYWQVAQVFKFLSATEANARLVSVLWGMIGLVSIFVVSYLVARNYFVALLATLLMAISISSLMYDRKLRMYSMFVPVFLWFSYAIYFLIESKARRGWRRINEVSKKIDFNLNFLPAVVVLGLLSLATHVLTVNIAPAVIVYALLLLIIQYRKDKKLSAKYLLLVAAPVVAGALSLGSARYQVAFEFFSFWINNWSYLEKVTLDYSYAPLAGIFFVIGCYYLIKYKSRIGLWTVVSYLTILFFAIMVWKRSAGHQYILLSQSFKIIIMASGIYFAAKTLSEKVFTGSKKWFGVLLIVFILLLINFTYFLSKESFYGKITKWNYSNYREVYDYYVRHRSENNALITRPPINYYLRGTDTELIGYGDIGYEDLTVERIIQAQKEYDDLWLIFSRTYSIDGEARDFYKKNFTKIETKYTNDEIEVWRWMRDTNTTNKNTKATNENDPNN